MNSVLAQDACLTKWLAHTLQEVENSRKMFTALL